MNKFLFVFFILCISHGNLMADVTVTYISTSPTAPMTIPYPNNLGNVNMSLSLSKPSNQITSGLVRIYVKGEGQAASQVYFSSTIPNASWTGSGTAYFTLSISFDITLTQMNYRSGVLYAQYEDDGGVNSKGNDVAVIVPIFSNTITAPAVTSFISSGDPGVITGSSPGGGTGMYTYKWQSSTTSISAGFSDIPSSAGISFDPATISQTTYYRRIVTSTTQTNTSNVVTIVVAPPGATFANPIEIGNLSACASYEDVKDNSPGNHYGNEYGNSSDDIFYKFTLTTSAVVKLNNCKPDGLTSAYYLLDSGGSLITNGTPGAPCDHGSETDYVLSSGVYYVVSEGPNTTEHILPIHISTKPQLTVSSNVTILAGGSTTLSASGYDTYSWSPSTGLSATTGASVTASPSSTTTYTVQSFAGGCFNANTVTVTVTGVIGSTITNPIVANISGCGFGWGPYDLTGYGNDYGGSTLDVFFSFTIGSTTSVNIDGYSDVNLHLYLLDGSGSLIDQQYYGWVDSGDDAGTYIFVPTDGSPLRPSLPAGTYYVVAEGTSSDGSIGVTIETPAGTSCRKSTPSISRRSDQFVTIENSESTATILFYPNPASNKLYFNKSNAADFSVRIMDLHGSCVKMLEFKEAISTVDISDLAPGMYIISYHKQGVLYNDKLIITR